MRQKPSSVQIANSSAGVSAVEQTAARCALAQADNSTAPRKPMMSRWRRPAKRKDAVQTAAEEDNAITFDMPSIIREAKEKDVFARMVIFAIVPLSIGRITAWVFAGLAVGLGARSLFGGGKGGVTDAILGLVGGFFGGLGYVLMLEGLAIPWVSVMTAACGALVLVAMRDGQAK